MNEEKPSKLTEILEFLRSARVMGFGLTLYCLHMTMVVWEKDPKSIDATQIILTVILLGQGLLNIAQGMNAMNANMGNLKKDIVEAVKSHFPPKQDEPERPMAAAAPPPPPVA